MRGDRGGDREKNDRALDDPGRGRRLGVRVPASARLGADPCLYCGIHRLLLPLFPSDDPIIASELKKSFLTLESVIASLSFINI